MPEKGPDPWIRPIRGGSRLRLVPDPRSYLSARAEELAALEARLHELQRALSRSHELFLEYLEGRSTAEDWEKARTAADQTRVAYERKCAAILVRTFRI